MNRAGAKDAAGRRSALEELLKRYWQPMRVYVQYRMGIDAHRADDMVQGFIASRILEKNLLGGADPRKGRFRGFLMVALARFVLNQVRDEKASKRGQRGQDHIGRIADPSDRSWPPGRAFELAWARQVLQDAAEVFRKECFATGREDYWSVFEGRVLLPALDDREPTPYAQLIAQHHFASPVQACNTLATAKRQFNRCLRKVISEYEVEDADIDAELDDLRSIVFRGARSRPKP